MSPGKPTWKDRLLENGVYKLVAFIVAMIVWVTVLGRRDVNLTRSVDLEFNVGDKLVILNDVASQVDFRISGSRFAVKKFQRRELEPIRIDVSNVGPGRRLITVPDDSLRLPLGLRVLSIQPQSIFLELAESIQKRVPVRAYFGSQGPPEGVEVREVIPPSIEIRGASQILAKIDELSTEKLDLSGIQFHDGEPQEIKAQVMWPRLQGVTGGEPRGVTLKLVKGRKK